MLKLIINIRKVSIIEIYYWKINLINITSNIDWIKIKIKIKIVSSVFFYSYLFNLT